MAEGDHGAFSLYLRPKQPDNTDEESLSRRFRDIVAQKGHFRMVTESSLTADDEEAEELAQDGTKTEDEEDAEEERGTLKHVNESKQKMVQMVSAAHEQAMFLVDFVSLLESRYSDAGQLSMSQGIKQVIPPKTLAYDEWPVQELDGAEKTTNQLVAQSQRLKGLHSSADELLRAAARLQDDVKKETTYWDEILSVTDAGWAVCRVSKGQHQLGVQLGFPQAGSLFTYRGFVPLTPGEDGTLRLGQQAARRPKKLRLCIRNEDGSNGSNLSAWSASEEEGIEGRIHSARDSLFEEELFHELSAEARILTGYGVKLKGSAVHIPLHLMGIAGFAKGELQLDLVHQTHREMPTNRPLIDEQANQLALALKLLMLHTYEQRRDHVAKPPAPLSERKRPPRVPTLIRPLIMHGFHHSTVLHLRQYIDTISSVFKLAKLDIKATQVATTPTLTGEASQQLIATLIGPCTTDVRVPLLSGTDDLQISVQTETGSREPLLGTTMAVTTTTRQSSNGVKSDTAAALSEDENAYGTKLSQQVFDRHEDVVSYLNELWALDIAHNIIARERDGSVAREQEPEVDIVQGNTDGKARTSVRLRIFCSEASLTLAWRKAHIKGAAGEFRWTTHDEGNPSFAEALQSILKAE